MLIKNATEKSLGTEEPRQRGTRNLVSETREWAREGTRHNHKAKEWEFGITLVVSDEKKGRRPIQWPEKKD